MFCRKTLDIVLDLPLGLFHCLKFEKQPLERIQGYENVSFWGKKQPTLPEGDFFLQKIIIISFSCTSWPLSLCKVYENILAAD